MNREVWVRSADRALSLATGQIKLIRAVTPENAATELVLLEQAFRRGVTRLPRWTYNAPPLRPELCPALDRLARVLEARSPLAAVYAARARELCLEAEIIEAVGTPKLRRLAGQRFLGQSPGERDDEHQADDLARAWTEAPEPEDASHQTEAGSARGAIPRRVRSCDSTDPDSLISRMSCEAGRQRIAFRVVVQPGLASLAATADGAILVAAGKWLGRHDVERTVLHEISGHALPRARAAEMALGIFAIGTARGIDDQEGRALWLEQAAGFLDGARRRELGCRHLAARATLEGASFADVVMLLQARYASVEAAVRIAARVQRGSHGAGGLAREIVYLPALIRVERALRGERACEVERMMRGGRIAADVAPTVAVATAMSEALRVDAANVPYDERRWPHEDQEKRARSN